jgi:hypothetical protein
MLHTKVLDTTLITSETCSITTPGIAQGAFVVSPYATTNINWTLTVRGSPSMDTTAYAVFNDTADVVVTPTSGTINTVFTYTGSGFSSTATTCKATVLPPFPAPLGEPEAPAPSCYISAGTGQVSGSVIVPASAVSGTYGVEVSAAGGTGGNNSATGIFTVGTPSALVVLNPASASQGSAVGVAGFGFNGNDSYCTISSSAVNLFADTPTCVIAGGYASGSFTINATAEGGYYLITIQACSGPPTNKPYGKIGIPTCEAPYVGLDFASNFLGVVLVATVSSTSFTTTTSSSTTTSLTTTTTSVATQFSYSSTTYSTTGIFFTTYTHFSLQTVSGQTTTTQTQSSSTTQTQTTVTYSTTTQFTTVPCGPLPCGFQVQPAPINPAPEIDGTGLLAVLLLLIPMLLRRLFGG